MWHCCTAMHRPNAPISLADLSAAGVQLRPYEAVTIVRELLVQVARGDVAGVPSAHVIRLSGTGFVSVEGPVAAGGRPVLRAAQLLDSLLPASDAGKEFRVPGGLKLVLARALGTLDLPPFPSLESFAEALGRFGATNASAVITDLVNAWADIAAARAPQAVEVEVEPLPAAQVQPFISARTQDVHAHLSHEPLTVSDIRRARRATGLPLSAISERSHIPVGMLRQLEWGYFANWPAGNDGRAQLVRYARGAGLDEQLVVATLLPLLAECSTSAPVVTPAAASGVAGDDAAEVVDGVPSAALVPRTVPVTSTELEPAGARVLQRTVVQSPSRGRWRAAALAALAIPALLAIGLLPVWWAETSNVRTSGAPISASNSPAPPDGPASARTRPEPPAPTVSRREPAPEDPIPGTTSAQATPQQERRAPAAGHPAEYRLTADRTFSPSFGSVGTAMFYQARSSDGSALMRADTDHEGDVLRITRIVDDTANNWHVRPSPDGKQIAFDSDRDGIRGVYVADADGKHVRRVSGEGYAAVPSWSPDGGTLAFVRGTGPQPHDTWNLWTLDVSSGDARQITRNKIGQPWGGSWFPDGRHIAYSLETRLVIHDIENGTERAFETPIKGRLVRTPAVSPDGRRVAFQVFRSGTWLLELSNGSMRRILDDPTAEEYTWSPDGRRLAYHSRRSGAWGVWVMAPR
jgi:Helix-turn-helix domain/WD40-like Beta Propeller Repeat